MRHSIFFSIERLPAHLPARPPARPPACTLACTRTGGMCSTERTATTRRAALRLLAARFGRSCGLHTSWSIFGRAFESHAPVRCTHTRTHARARTHTSVYPGAIDGGCLSPEAAVWLAAAAPPVRRAGCPADALAEECPYCRDSDSVRVLLALSATASMNGRMLTAVSSSYGPSSYGPSRHGPSSYGPSGRMVTAVGHQAGMARVGMAQVVMAQVVMAQVVMALRQNGNRRRAS